jgi:NADPH:quinone reductase-like Zn-dependent oxidoreductase
MIAVQLNAYGDPVENVEIVNVPEPNAPGLNEVLIGLEYSPINPADLLLAMGYYAVKPTLPSIIGNEGVGKVIAVGHGVTNVKVGDRVVPPLSSFAWREQMLIPAQGLLALPVDADPKQLAMVAINPVTAFLLLSEFRTLHVGDWIAQNAANSGVGRAIIAIAKERGLKTLNIVRRPELVTELTVAGADAVVVDGPNIVEEIKSATNNAEIKFALDCLSGSATGVLASVLAYGGTLVTYGAMSHSPITVGPRDVVYKSLNLTGFFLGHPQHATKFPALIQEAATLVASGKLNVPIAAVYPLSSIKEALTHSKNGGKVMLDMVGR